MYATVRHASRPKRAAPCEGASELPEAASAAVVYLQEGWDVELVTRTTRVSSGAGARQRRRVLEALALLQAAPVDARPLSSEGRREVRFDR